MRKEKGITLIALVITIIVLLILAGVTIVTLTGDNGLMTKAGEAKNTNIEAEGLEKIKLAIMTSYDDTGINTTVLAKELSKITGVKDENNKEITEDDEIILPIMINLNNKKYTIKKDGTIEKVNNALPEEYQEVEYIASTGSQYIDTRVKPTLNTKVRCILSSDNMGTAQNIAYYGARTSPYEDTNFCCINHNVSKKLRFDRGNFESSGYSNLIGSGTFYEIIQDKNENYVNGLKVSESNGNFDNVNYNIFIFGINQSGTYLKNQDWLEDKISFKLFQIYNNGELYRYFIPCYSIKTVTDVNENTCQAGTIGMYDTIEGKFYTNQGEGEFIAGPEV